MSNFIDAAARSSAVPPALQISDQRAQLIARHVEALDAAMESAHADGHFEYHCEKFIDDVTRMGFWDRLLDVFQSGSQKRETLKAVARCHVATHKYGRRYLHNKGYFPVKVSDQSLYLLQRLTPAARASLLAWSPDSAPAVSGLSTVVVGIPGTPLRVPLLPRCFSTAEGALSEHEANQLMNLEAGDGLTLRETILRKEAALNEGACAYTAKQDEILAEAYVLGGRREDAATEYFKAVLHHARGRQYAAATRCLIRACECFPSGSDCHGLARQIAGAASACDLKGLYAMAGILSVCVADLYEQAGASAMANAFRARADDRLGKVGLRQDNFDNADAVAAAFDATIRRNRDALASTGLASTTNAVFMDDMSDPISAMDFDAGEGERWCLLLRGAHDGKRTYDLITEDTARQLERRGMHPMRRDLLEIGDIVRGTAALDLLVGCEPELPPLGRALS